MRLGLLLFLATTLASASPAGAGTASNDPSQFPRPAELEAPIRFWRAIFTEYSTHQVVLHDALHLDKVYKVLDFRPEVDEGQSEVQVERIQRAETDLEVDRLRAILLRLDGMGAALQPGQLTPEERAVYEVVGAEGPADRFRDAADEKRLRTQRGLRERFGDGLRVSRRYLPEMERIFRAEGLPVELTRLPLIESCFNVNAYSKVGAAGIWQFMPATGRKYMRIDRVVDERRDPIASTRAAARFLARMYDTLGSWPLTITAYNHGPAGIARAVDEIGTSDIGRIVREYRGNAFGFASRNFYAEFLAAVDVERDPTPHFGELPAEAPVEVREHELDRSIGIEQAARIAETGREDVASLNPALSDEVVEGRRPIPAGYRLRLPEAGATRLATRLGSGSDEPAIERVVARVPAAKKTARKTPTRRAAVTHRVRAGQTLSHIAKQHRVSVAALRSANRMGNATRLRPGQVLRIPGAAGAESST
jgi:membrane-bound lytic murein transglycosylase D